jgi:signal transduction histidine kinase
VKAAVINDIEADLSAIAGIAAVPTILEVVCSTTGMGFAAVARVTEDRWVACCVRDEIAFGLQPGSELKVETTICNEIRENRQAVIIDHVAEDPVFSRHHTPAIYGFQSYISMPIVLPNGVLFGTLCAIDRRPARLNRPAIIGMFQLFADLIAFHLDANQRLQTSAADLLDIRKSAELREQFIAVLGHDLRNPLASISAGTRLLLKTPLDAESKSIINLMQNSVSRMSGIIDNVLDFARGRMGRGLKLEEEDAEAAGAILTQVIAELRLSHPDRIIDMDIAEMPRMRCDRSRLGQLLSNLLANALTHGAPGRPVRVAAAVHGDTFELSVANEGAEIPPETIKDLFRPFFRGARASQNGLGLGLYIASEIARAHKGSLTVVSSPEETRFTFRMPARSPASPAPLPRAEPAPAALD